MLIINGMAIFINKGEDQIGKNEKVKYLLI